VTAKVFPILSIRLILPAPVSILEIEDLRFRSHIDQMGTTIQLHVREELRFIHFAILGAGSAQANQHFVFDKVGQVIIGAIPGGGLLVEVPGLVRPGHSPIDEEEIHLMTFRMSDLCELKAPRCSFIVILAQDEQEISHATPPLLYRGSWLKIVQTDESWCCKIRSQRGYEQAQRSGPQRKVKKGREEHLASILKASTKLVHNSQIPMLSSLSRRQA
jgi:hypothetical protein